MAQLEGIHFSQLALPSVKAQPSDAQAQEDNDDHPQ